MYIYYIRCIPTYSIMNLILMILIYIQNAIINYKIIFDGNLFTPLNWKWYVVELLSLGKNKVFS